MYRQRNSVARSTSIVSPYDWSVRRLQWQPHAHRPTSAMLYTIAAGSVNNAFVLRYVERTNVFIRIHALNMRKKAFGLICVVQLANQEQAVSTA
jgi:hypothetical protein